MCLSLSSSTVAKDATVELCSIPHSRKIRDLQQETSCYLTIAQWKVRLKLVIILC